MMSATEMISGVSAGLFFLLAFVYFLRLLEAWMLHRTLRDAIRANSEHSATLVDRIGRSDLSLPRGGSGSDDRTGIVLVALGLALAGFSLVVGDPQWLRYGLGGALFPILVGAALLVRHTIVRRTDERGLAAGA
jgi:hypothetical protein